MGELVETRREGRVCLVTLRRDEKRNAFSAELSAGAAHEAFEEKRRPDFGAPRQEPPDC